MNKQENKYDDLSDLSSSEKASVKHWCSQGRFNLKLYRSLKKVRMERFKEVSINHQESFVI